MCFEREAIWGKQWSELAYQDRINTLGQCRTAFLKSVLFILAVPQLRSGPLLLGLEGLAFERVSCALLSVLTLMVRQAAGNL